jgi:hypothetical protein
MGTSSSIGSLATALASLGTTFFTIMAFTLANKPNQISMVNSGQGFVGYAVMAWLGVVFLAFGWAGAACSLKKQHFGLAITGALLILASCPFEYAILMYAPTSGMLPLIYTWGGTIILQLLLALAGVFFTAKSKHQFFVVKVSGV